MNTITTAMHKIGYQRLIAFIYALIALSILFEPHAQALEWFSKAYAVPAGLFAAAFFFGAAILFAANNFYWFCIGLSPVALYSLISIMYAKAMNSANLGVVIGYAVMLVAVPIAYRIDYSTVRLKIQHFWIGFMLVLGITVAFSPPRGAVAYISYNYQLASTAAGLSLIIGAIILAIRPRFLTFLATAWMLVFYVANVVIFGIRSDNHAAALINTILLVTLFLTIGRASDYFPQHNSSHTVLSAGV